MSTTCWPALAARSSPQRWVRSRFPKKSSTTCILLRAYGLGQMGGQLRARNLGLNAGGEVLHGKDTGLKLILAQDDNGSRDLVGSLERFLEAESAIAKLDVEAGVAKLPRQVESSRVQVFTQRSNVRVCLLRRRRLKSQQRQNQAVLAHCEANSGSLGSADC